MRERVSDVKCTKSRLLDYLLMMIDIVVLVV